MSRLFRALWADKTLLLVLVPVALACTAFLVNRSAADEVVRTSATSTTTTAAPAQGSEQAADVPQTTMAPGADGGFDSGGRTVTDDSGNLVRVPNDVSYGSSAPASVAGVSETAPGTDAIGEATTTTVAGATTTTVAGATTTLPGTTTTTTLPVDPSPVVSESPLSILLPVSGIAVVGLAWVGVSFRRRRAGGAAR